MIIDRLSVCIYWITPQSVKDYLDLPVDYCNEGLNELGQQRYRHALFAFDVDELIKDLFKGSTWAG